MEARTLRLGGLMLVIALFAIACSSGDDTTTTAASATTTTAAQTTTTAAAETTTTAAPDTDATGESSVAIADFAFNPGDITVAVGTTVTWNNGDSVSHTTTSDEEGWDSGALGTGDTFEVVFAEPGAFAYHCTIHPTMTGTITVEG